MTLFGFRLDLVGGAGWLGLGLTALGSVSCDITHETLVLRLGAGAGVGGWAGLGRLSGLGLGLGWGAGAGIGLGLGLASNLRGGRLSIKPGTTSSCLGHECLAPWIHRPAGIRTWLLRPNGYTGGVDDRLLVPSWHALRAWKLSWPAWLRREALVAWVCPNGCTGCMDLPFGHGCSVDALSKEVLETYLRGGLVAGIFHQTLSLHTPEPDQVSWSARNQYTGSMDVFMFGA